MRIRRKYPERTEIFTTVGMVLTFVTLRSKIHTLWGGGGTMVEVSMYVISNKPRFLGQINPTITISPSPDDRQWRIRSK